MEEEAKLNTHATGRLGRWQPIVLLSLTRSSVSYRHRAVPEKQPGNGNKRKWYIMTVLGERISKTEMHVGGRVPQGERQNPRKTCFL